jgi:gamma-glutamylcyclotransferase (GGCT)/AIG2-like uncharacterized protein YtfP
MLYFAYGSNLNRKQMKRRCKDSIIKKKTTLKNYLLTFRSKYGAADIEKNKNSKVYGAIYEISKLDEKKLDIYEEYPTLYKKKFFKNNNKLIMFYIMHKKTKRTPPTARYLKTIKQGYKDWKINIKSLNAALLTVKHLQQK